MNVVVHNLGAMNANRQLGITYRSRQKTTEKLSSGFRINRAADDAAGLTISEKMRSLARGLHQGARNTQDGISLCQVADGALAEVDDMLHRMTELSIKASNGTNTAEERHAIQQEINALRGEIDRVSKSTEFNTRHIFDGNLDFKKEVISRSLIESPSASKGYISEAYAANGGYYSCATLDFSKLDSEKIEMLMGKTFSFDCSINCGERFSFTFTDGTDCSVNEETFGSRVPHNYNIGIEGLTTGSEVLNKLYDYVSAHHPSESTGVTLHEGITVSHSNNLIKVDDNTLVIAENHTAHSSKNVAETHYKEIYKGANHPGAVDFQEIAGGKDEEIEYSELWIQSGAVKDDGLYLRINRINEKILGIDKVDVTTIDQARGAIATIDQALDKVNETRSRIGAYQNRLEHTFDNVSNIAENTEAAESQIRDADMAAEMMRFAKDGILAQAGQALLSQAGRDPESVLTLLR
ncbi:MAG: flagellin [Lachnospiraceae bacterium]|nr:flagellin [Lachnospiraceae bacterium]